MFLLALSVFSTQDSKTSYEDKCYVSLVDSREIIVVL